MVKPYNFLCKAASQSRRLFSFFPQIPPFFPQKRHCSQNVHVFFKIRSTFSPLSMVSYGCRQEVTKNSFFSLLSLKGNTRCSEGRTEQRVLLFFFLSSLPSASAQTIPSLQSPGKGIFRMVVLLRTTFALRRRQQRHPDSIALQRLDGGLCHSSR